MLKFSTIREVDVELVIIALNGCLKPTTAHPTIHIKVGDTGLPHRTL
jgi:hypothetical protein